eukprot:3860963-Amphidinium_carterae.1
MGSNGPTTSTTKEQERKDDHYQSTTLVTTPTTTTTVRSGTIRSGTQPDYPQYQTQKSVQQVKQQPAPGPLAFGISI